MDYMIKRSKMPEAAKAAAKQDPALMEFIRIAAEAAKCGLSSEILKVKGTPIDFEHDRVKHSISTALTIPELDQCCAGLVKNAMLKVTDLLTSLNMSRKDIETVLLVGGSSRLPSLREAIKFSFGFAASEALNADTAVASGAALLAAQIINGEKPPFRDVAPLGLGVGTWNGDVRMLIEPNTTLPAHGSHTFSTSHDGQTTVSFPVYEGNRKSQTDNKLIDEFKIQIEEMPQGVPKILVNFTIDEDGKNWLNWLIENRISAQLLNKQH